MDSGACNNCTTTINTDTRTRIEHYGTHFVLCLDCARDVVSVVDDLMEDGMESFSPQRHERCSNCLIPFQDEVVSKRAVLVELVKLAYQNRAG
jgi:hypothetical protein